MNDIGARKHLQVVFYLMNFPIEELSDRVQAEDPAREMEFDQSPGDEPERGFSLAYRK